MARIDLWSGKIIEEEKPAPLLTGKETKPITPTPIKFEVEDIKEIVKKGVEMWDAIAKFLEKARTEAEKARFKKALAEAGVEVLPKPEKVTEYKKAMREVGVEVL